MQTEILDANAAGLRRLQALGASAGRLLSVCFELDPAIPTAATRAVQARGRLDEAARDLEREVPEPDQELLRAALRQLRGSVVEAAECHSGLRGIAAFADGEDRLLVFGLRRPLAQPLKAAFARQPLLEPLFEAQPGPSWGVLVADRRHGAVFRGSEQRLTEVASVDDDVHRRHSQGGWSQARYERGIDKEVHDHVERASVLLSEADRRLRFDHLALVAPEEIWPEVEAALSRELSDRLAGHVAHDLPHPHPGEVLELVRPLISRVGRAREVDALDRLEARLAEDGKAAAGEGDVLAAIGERKVETLLVDKGREDEATDAAISGAMEQDADVVFVENDALGPVGHLAALLRY